MLKATQTLSFHGLSPKKTSLLDNPVSPFQAVQAQNNKSHFSQCDGKQDLSAMFPSGAIVKVIIYHYINDYLCRHSVKYIILYCRNSVSKVTTLVE